MTESAHPHHAAEPPEPLLQTPGTLVSALVSGKPVNFFVTNGRDPIQNHHLRGLFFEQDELDIMARAIARDSICVDIGANIGNHALFFDKFTPAKTVILFEVNPDAIRLLKIHHLINQPSSWDMAYLGFALGSKPGRVSKFIEDHDNLGSAQFREAADGTFRSITGDSVLASRRIDFIKIDVEGAELDVLAGMEETITRWRPNMFIELADHLFERFSMWMENNAYEVKEKYERYAGLPNYLISPK